MTTRTIITTVIVLTFLGITGGIVIARHLPAHAKAAVSSVQPVHAPKPTTTAPVLSEVATDVNNERTQAGLAPLTEDARLDASATAKCADMVAKDYYAHHAPDGTTEWHFITDAGVTYRYAGENLAQGFTRADTAVAAWMASPGHRANILNTTYSEVGYAECIVPGYSDIVVQHFAGF